jgi:integral membrane sensor domain MASE1
VNLQVIAKSSVRIICAATAIALAYFLAARLGLTLLSVPSDVAVFWPASGIAAGILIAFGRPALPALVIGVVTAPIAANLLSDRNIWVSVLKGFCNAGEAALAAWLLERWFGPEFAIGDLRRVLGFLAAAGLATAASALGGALTIVSLHTPAPLWEVWRAWFLSDGVGLVVIGSLVIGLGQMWREPPTREEQLEGLGWVALMAFLSAYLTAQRADSWLSFSPGCVELPLLLWLSAWYPPVFALSSASLMSIIVIGATTLGIGRFGDANIAAIERVQGAQLTVTMVTAFTLVLIALFSERRSQQDLLSANNKRLRHQEEAFRRLLGADMSEAAPCRRRAGDDPRAPRWHYRSLHPLPGSAAR